MSRRLPDEGTVFQRKDGKWVAALRVGDKRVFRYGKSRQEVLDKLDALRGQRRDRTLTLPTDLTLADWVEQWLRMREPDLRPSTLRMYRQTLGYVTGVIGTMKMHRLTPLVIQQAFTTLQQTTNARRGLYLAYGYLRACLEHAVELGVIGSHPMNGVKRPRWKPRQRTYWTAEQTKRFIHAGLTSGGWYHPLFVFLVATGLRLSEALALTWKDIDLDSRTVTIDKALVWYGNAYSIVPPKTEAGFRTITLTRAAVEALARQPNGEPDQPIFLTQTGRHPHPQNLRDYLVRLCEIAGVPPINIHGLRHVHAMLALKAINDPYLLQRRLGHSHVRVTLEIYGYTDRDEGGLAGVIDRLLD